MTLDPHISRAIGCFLGLAIGDALGAPVEFSSPGTFQPVTGYRSGGPFNLKAGQYTDDTSMALCLADSLIACKGMDLEDQIKCYLRWYHQGENSSTGHCFDIGSGTAQALHRYISDGNPVAGVESGQGNGSIMRLAPVAIAFWFDPELAATNGEASALTTHGSDIALDCTGHLAKVLAILIQGGSKQDVLQASRGHSDRLVKVLEGNWEGRQVRGSGHVLATLEAALWAFHTTNSFEECVLKAVNLGDDADSVGAVAGQLAGAFYGVSGIPEGLIQGLQDAGRIRDMAVTLASLHFNT
jgi:ADP-ribosyl-[dinitrogen reductase] hydrolase